MKKNLKISNVHSFVWKGLNVDMSVWLNAEIVKLFKTSLVRLTY